MEAKFKKKMCWRFTSHIHGTLECWEDQTQSLEVTWARNSLSSVRSRALNGEISRVPSLWDAHRITPTGPSSSWISRMRGSRTQTDGDSVSVWLQILLNPLPHHTAQPPVTLDVAWRRRTQLTYSATTWLATPSSTITTENGANGQPKVRQIPSALACKVGSIIIIIIITEV